jgi:hypothetical protein
VIPPKGTVPISFEFDSVEVEIPLHDFQEGYRFDTVLQPEQVVTPLKLQYQQETPFRGF